MTATASRAPAMRGQGRYELDIDISRGMFKIRLIGFLDSETVHRLHAERRIAIARLGLPPHAHVSLCDLTECPIQSQETAAVFREIMSDPSLVSRRLAFVTGSALSSMQTRRIMARREGVACFDDASAAEAWLMEA